MNPTRATVNRFFLKKHKSQRTKRAGSKKTVQMLWAKKQAEHCWLLSRSEKAESSAGSVKHSVKIQVAQSYPTLCDPVDYTVHGNLQTRILECAFSFSRGSSQPRDWNQLSHITTDSLPAEPQGKTKNTGVGSPPLLRYQGSWYLSDQGSPLKSNPTYTYHLGLSPSAESFYQER